MLYLWWPGFLIPAVMVLCGVLRRPAYRGLRPLTAHQQAHADRLFHTLLRQVGAALAVLTFLVMRSVARLGVPQQRIGVYVFCMLEAAAAILLVVPVGRAAADISGEDAMEYTEQAPAKLNLTLTVEGKRPDGYHDITSVMVCVSLCDTVRVRRGTGQGIRLTCNWEALAVPDNLVCRAAEAFFRRTEIACDGVDIALEKRIPLQAGLGGGSADAAAALRCLRRLYAPTLPTAELADIGAEVGSDVPFCVCGGAALAEGRGERLTPMPPLPPCWVVICKPDCANATGAMYAAIDAQQPQVRCDHVGICAALERQDLRAAAQRLGNVFEAVMPPDSPVFAVKRHLTAHGALNALMSGSGTAVYGLFDDESAARAAVEALRGTWRDVFLAQSV